MRGTRVNYFSCCLVLTRLALLVQGTTRPLALLSNNSSRLGRHLVTRWRACMHATRCTAAGSLQACMQLVARLHANSCMFAVKLVATLHAISCMHACSWVLACSVVGSSFDVTFLSGARVGMWSEELKEEYYTRAGSNRWECGISFGAE